MNKRNRKLVTLMIAMAVMGYALVGNSFVNADSAYAHADMEIQNMDDECEDGRPDCPQEHSADCGDCAPSGNHCHSDYSLILLYKLDLFHSQVLSFSKQQCKYSNLNYPPEAPPS